MMFFFVAYADLPTPPPPPPAVYAPAPSQPAPVVLVPANPPQARTTPTVAVSGHYTCNDACVVDPDPEPHPLAPGSDVPGQTLGSTDRPYGLLLTSMVCEAKPWTCEP